MLRPRSGLGYLVFLSVSGSQPSPLNARRLRLQVFLSLSTSLLPDRAVACERLLPDPRPCVAVAASGPIWRHPPAGEAGQDAGCVWLWSVNVLCFYRRYRQGEEGNCKERVKEEGRRVTSNE